MSIGAESEPSGLEHLSALTDGEVDASGAAQACAMWRDEASARSTWHAYQMIGDVLRSEDLSSSATHDASFLATLRLRLADEPIVLAPEPLPASDSVHVADVPLVANGKRRARRTWLAPTAVAAGLVLVTGALLATRGPVPGSGTEGVFARLGFGKPASSVQVVALEKSAVADASVEPQSVILTGKVLRDARIDRYLAAHQQFAGTSALGVPSGFLRNAAADAPNR